MPISNSTEPNAARALQIWAEYQQNHDIADQIGQTVGVDPISGRLWFGESASDVVQKMDAEGVKARLYCLRVGRDYYVRKGGHR
jgi:hypothetical protein